jgi:hypothetical protein
MKNKKTVHYRIKGILARACDPLASIDGIKLTNDKRKVTCDNCIKTNVYQYKKGA